MVEKITKLLNDQFDFVGYTSLNSYQKALEKYQFYQRFDKINHDAYETIAVVGLAYPKEPVLFKGKGYGLLSRYSYGTDYHQVFKRKFEEIKKSFPSLYCDVDSQFINERLAASLTHQGYIGKNQAFIHKDFGPYVFLATILLPFTVEETVLDIDSCGACNKCVQACPTGALDNGFNIERCLSHITQSKTVLEDFHIENIKRMVYGCDICYQVCPKTKSINIPKHKEFMPSGIENVDLIELLNMSNKSYMQTYGRNASSWRGASVIKKNALAILYNQNVEEAIPVIKNSIKQIDAEWYTASALKILDKFKER